MSIAKKCDCGKAQPYCTGECRSGLLTKFGNVDISDLMVKIRETSQEAEDRFQKAFYERDMDWERKAWTEVIGIVFNHEGELPYEAIIDELMSKYRIEKA